MLVLLQSLHYKTFIRDIKIEVFGLLIAAISICFGIWLGLEVIKRKQVETLNFKNATKFKISSRELRVLDLMTEGFSNQKMADQLFVSLDTIKTHNAKIFQKLQVTRRTQAVKKAKDLNIISYLPVKN
jgi:DNA-binding NarL/FixJ family response regulator